MEELFAATEARVVSAFKVAKCTPSTGSTWNAKKKLPKTKGKPRVLCLTAERRSKRRGFKGSVHICKLDAGRFQVRNTYLLKFLTRMEALTDPSKPNQPQFLELWFSNNAFTSESRFAFEIEDTESLQEAMGTIYLFCKRNERKVPAVVGAEASNVEKWGAQAERSNEGSDFGATLLSADEAG
ncbi:hypothetical protein WJX74_002055 [Apatococcus lobatus]|uniref:Uncharacterized protein n=1 Tax=Apatococcus lobatus TaxID=904363 RepID=A0AAW1RKM7_9CHLO